MRLRQLITCSLALAIISLVAGSGCKTAKSINPFAAYGSPRIAAPGTGSFAIPGQTANGAAGQVGTGGTVGGQPAGGVDPYYGTQTQPGTSVTPTGTGVGAGGTMTPGGMPTRSIQSTPAAGGNQWSPVLPNTLNNSSTQTGTNNNVTQNLTPASNLPGASMIPSTQTTNGGYDASQASFQTTTPTNGADNKFGPMRVNDASQMSAPQQFTPPANVIPIGSVNQPGTAVPTSGGQAVSLPPNQQFVPTQQYVPTNNQAVAVATTLPPTVVAQPQQPGATPTVVTSSGTPTNSGWSSR